MNADLTINTIDFNKTFDEKEMSERRSSARGINTPDVLTIRSQDYVDSASKVAGRRFTGRVDRVDLDANNKLVTTSGYFVFAIPETAAQAWIDNVVATFKAAVADANFIADVLNNEK